LIGDYKTGRRRPDDQNHVTQLALYRAVLAKLYPGRAVRAALVWTAEPALVELDSAALDAALLRVTST
jgi:ATP-dependent helicase/nuclease subunit A